MDLYHGVLRAIDASGQRDIRSGGLSEFQRLPDGGGTPWSYTKFPVHQTARQSDGWYRVGPPSRMNTAGFIDTPLADEAHQAFRLLRGRPNQMSLAYHWARMIEVLHCVEKIRHLLHMTLICRGANCCPRPAPEEG